MRSAMGSRSSPGSATCASSMRRGPTVRSSMIDEALASDRKITDAVPASASEGALPIAWDALATAKALASDNVTSMAAIGVASYGS